MTGGQLDPHVSPGSGPDNIDFKLVAGGGAKLTVFLLTGHGKVSVWGEARENSFLPCLFSLSREVVVADLALHRGGLLVVSRGGEAWTGVHQQGRATARAPTADLIKLKRLPHIHRAVAASCDSKGRNFCVLQVTPHEALTLVPEVAPSEMQEHLARLLQEVQEQDSLSDVICCVGGRRFPAHSFVLASGSESLSKQLRFLEDEEQEGVVEVQVEEVHPDTFTQVLQFLYTKRCDLLQEGASSPGISVRGKQEEKQEWDILELNGRDPGKVSAFQVYSENKARRKKGGRGADQEAAAAVKKAKSRCALALLQEAAKSLGVFGLAKLCECFRVEEGMVVVKSRPPPGKLDFSLKHLPELYDVTISCEEEREVPAHKCVLVARSDYFAGMFSSCWSEASSCLSLPLPCPVVEAMLEFLYRDDCRQITGSEDLDFVCNILVVADQFLLARLKQLAEVQLTKMLTLKNAAELLQLSCTYLASQLKESAMQFICINLPALLEAHALEGLDPEVFRALDSFYRSSNPVFARRRLGPPWGGAPSREEVEEEYVMAPVSPEHLEEQEVVPRPRRHSSGEKGRRSPRVRTASMESSGGSGEEEELELDKLSLADFDIEEHEEEIRENVPNCPSEKSDKSFLTSILSPQQKPLEPPQAKSEKKGRLSQKDRKRLSLDVEQKKPATLASPDTPSKPAWLGWGAAPETPVSSSPSLSEIMRMENRPSPEVKKSSPTPPAILPRTRNISETEKKTEKKTSWKKISLGEDVVIAKPTPSPVQNCNPWKVPTTPNNNAVSFTSLERQEQTRNVNESFEQIMKEDVKQKEKTARALSKPLHLTQIEERAIEELKAFYNVSGVEDELITVSRLQEGVVAPPVWRRDRH